MFNFDNIEKVYSGRAHKCMCGCAGKYTYAKDSVRGVKIIAKKVLSNPNVEYDGDAAFVVDGNRIRAVYFKGAV